MSPFSAGWFGAEPFSYALGALCARRESVNASRERVHILRCHFYVFQSLSVASSKEAPEGMFKQFLFNLPKASFA